MKTHLLFIGSVCLMTTGADAQVTHTSIIHLRGVGGLISEATTQLNVSVTDSDRDTDPAQVDDFTIHLESPSDQVEPLTLVETGLSTGVFTGTMAFQWLAYGASPGATDGTVQGKSGDTLSARDDDPADDFGNPVTVRDEELVHGVSGQVSGTFDASASPYVLTGDTFVDKPDTLRVLAGVEMRLLPNVQLTIQDGAYLEILGQPGNVVVFTAHETGPSSAWGALELQTDFEDPISTTMQHAVFKKGGAGQPAMILSNRMLELVNCILRESESTGIQSGWDNHVGLTVHDTSFLDNAGDGCRFIGAFDMHGGNSERNGGSGIVACCAFPAISATLDSVLLRDNGQHGLADNTEIAQGSVTVSACIIVENGAHGIFKTTIGTPGALGVSDSELRDNQSGFDLYNDTAADVTARFNNWGPATTAEMNAGMNPKDITRIYDGYDLAGRGFVNYSAWLNPTPVDATTWSRIKDRFR